MNQQSNNSFFSMLLDEAERKYGEISPYYLARCQEVIDATLVKFGRVFALRVDLRFHNDRTDDDPDSPTCFQRADSKVITRFIDSLKSQLREDHRRKNKRGKPALFEYVWVREQCESVCHHYHLILLFKKDEYAFLGGYRESNSQNMAKRIRRAWCSASGLPYPDYACLVHFPDNPSYILDRNSANFGSIELYSFLLRVAYLAKIRTKPTETGLRNFGCSHP